MAVLAIVAIPALAFADRRGKVKDDLDLSAIKNQLVVLHDGSGHFVAIDPRGDWEHFYYGNGSKVLHRQRVYASGSADGTMTMTFWSPQVTGGPAEIELLPGDKWVMHCGDRDTPLIATPAKERERILAKAKFKKPLWPRIAYALARDDDGVYYYVDRLRDEQGGAGFRLFRGRKGKLALQKMRDVVNDSEGDIFATATGDLRLILGQKKSTWIARKKKKESRTELTLVPVADNTRLIYNELGVYAAQRLGTPCDDM